MLLNAALQSVEKGYPGDNALKFSELATCVLGRLKIEQESLQVRNITVLLNMFSLSTVADREQSPLRRFSPGSSRYY